MKRKDTPPTSETPGIFVYEALPLAGYSHGSCRFCGTAISACDGKVVKVVLVSGANEFFHATCLGTYATGLEHVLTRLAEDDDVIH